jgi:hypothetical protein
MSLENGEAAGEPAPEPADERVAAVVESGPPRSS